MPPEPMPEPGEKPRNPNRDEAKARAKAILEDPKHRRDKGSPDDMATVDAPLEEGSGT